MLYRTELFAGTFNTIGVPPLNEGRAGCSMVTTAAVFPAVTLKKIGSSPGELCKKVTSGGATQNSVPVCP